MAERDDDWEDLVLDDLEEELELDFNGAEKPVEEPEVEEEDESFYAGRLRLIEQAARRLKQD